MLKFSVGGQLFEAKISSIRKVDWNSLQPNFYMVLSPDLMQGFPATYITAFYLDMSEQELLNQIVRQFPTVSLISVDTILKQVNDIIEQVTVALSFDLLSSPLSAIVSPTRPSSAAIRTMCLPFPGPSPPG